MTRDNHVRRRIQTNSQNIADGLERFQDELLALFLSHLDKHRDEALRREEVSNAMIADLARQLGELRAGIEGLSVQIAELGDGSRRG